MVFFDALMVCATVHKFARFSLVAIGITFLRVETFCSNLQ